MIQKFDKDVTEDDKAHMYSVLYALAVKLLKYEELEEVKEVFSMTALGQMIFDDGLAKGMAEGLSRGLSQGLSQGITQGMIQGIIQMCKEFNLGKENACLRIMNACNLSHEAALETLENFGTRNSPELLP